MGLLDYEFRRFPNAWTRDNVPALQDGSKQVQEKSFGGAPRAAEHARSARDVYPR